MQVIERSPRVAVEAHEPFIVVQEDEHFDATDVELVGRLRSFDKGFTIHCDRAAVIDSASRLARSLGANILVLDKERPPSIFASGCHRIQARLYWTEDAGPLEHEVVWWPQRPLMMEDFRSDTLARPFRAATYCGIRYRVVPVGKQTRVVVEAYFDKELSYFKRGSDDELVLAHEQVHFDLAEVYARKFRQWVADGSFTHGDIGHRFRERLAATLKELALEQDRYDHEVYEDPSQQDRWTLDVARRNAELDGTSTHEALIHLRR